MRYIPIILAVFIISCQSIIKEEKIFTKNEIAIIKVNSDFQSTDSIYFMVAFASKLPEHYYNQKTLLKQDLTYIEIPCDRASTATISYSSKNHKIWISPGDTTTIKISGIDNSISLSSRFSQINQYYLDKQKALGFHDRLQPINQIIQKTNSHSDLLKKIDSIQELELNFLEKATLKPIYENFEKNDIVYGALNFKTTFPFFNDMAKLIKEPLPDDYYDFLSGVKVNNLEALSTANYFGFLDHYFWRDINKEDLRQYNGKSRAIFLRNYIHSKAISELDNSIKNYYFSNQFSNLVRFYNKAEEIDSLAIAWQVKEYESLVNHSGASLIQKKEKINEGEQVPDFVFEKVNGKFVQLSDLKNKIVYINFWGTWCKPCLVNIPDLNHMIKGYDGTENIAFLNICLKSKKEDWLKTVEKYKIKGLNLFINDQDEAIRLASAFNISGLPHYSILGKENILKLNYANKAPLVKNDLNTLLVKNK